MSAVSSVSTPGVLVTVMLRWSAVATVDMVDAVAEIGDQPQLLAGLAQHRGIDAVGHGRHQDFGRLDRLDQVGVAHRMVVDVEAGVEQLAHPRLDLVGQLARDNNERFSAIRHISALCQPSPSRDVPGRRSASDAPCSALLNPHRRHCGHRDRRGCGVARFDPSLSDGRIKTKHSWQGFLSRGF